MELKPGDKVVTKDGLPAEVEAQISTGEYVVKYPEGQTEILGHEEISFATVPSADDGYGNGYGYGDG